MHGLTLKPTVSFLWWTEKTLKWSQIFTVCCARCVCSKWQSIAWSGVKCVRKGGSSMNDMICVSSGHFWRLWMRKWITVSVVWPEPDWLSINTMCKVYDMKGYSVFIGNLSHGSVFASFDALYDGNRRSWLSLVGVVLPWPVISSRFSAARCSIHSSASLTSRTDLAGFRFLPVGSALFAARFF